MSVTFGYLTNSTTGIYHSHKQLSIYVGDKTTDKISLGSNNLTSAYLGNIPIGKEEKIYYDIVIGTGGYIAQSSGNYVVSTIKNCNDLNYITRGACPLSPTTGALYVIAGCAKYNTHLYVIPRNSNVLPQINLCGGTQVESEVIQILDKKVLKVGPRNLAEITKTTHPIEFYSYDSTYKYQSTYCLLTCPENDYSFGLKFEYKSLKSSGNTPGSSSCIQKTNVYGSTITGCTDVYGTGSNGTQFRIVVGGYGNSKSGLGFSNNSGHIWYSEIPSSTETFSLSGSVDKGEKPLNIRISPSPWKYNDTITISF